MWAIVAVLLVVAGGIAAFSMMPKPKGGENKKQGGHKWAHHGGQGQKGQKAPAKGKK